MPLSLLSPLNGIFASRIATCNMNYVVFLLFDCSYESDIVLCFLQDLATVLSQVSHKNPTKIVFHQNYESDMFQKVGPGSKNELFKRGVFCPGFFFTCLSG